MLIKSSNIHESSFLQQLIAYYDSIAGDGQIQRKMASYMSEVYGQIGDSVNLLVEGYMGNLLKFSNRFNNEIGEYDAEYIFNTEAMNNIITSLTTYKTNYKDSLDRLKPLVEIAKENGIEFDHVFDTNLFEQDLDQVIACPKSIIEKLEVINSDTTFSDNVNQLSSSLINFIEYAKTNINIGEFDVQQLQLDPNYINLINASIGVADQLHINAEAIYLENTSGNIANYKAFKANQLEKDQRVYNLAMLLLGTITTIIISGTLGPFIFWGIMATNAVSAVYNLAEYSEYDTLEENAARKGDSKSAAFNFVRDGIFCGNKDLYNGVKKGNDDINKVLNIAGGLKGMTRVSTVGAGTSQGKFYGLSFMDLGKQTAKDLSKKAMYNFMIDTIDNSLEDAGYSQRFRKLVTEGVIPGTKQTIGIGKSVVNYKKPKQPKEFDYYSPMIVSSIGRNSSSINVWVSLYIPFVENRGTSNVRLTKFITKSTSHKFNKINFKN